MALSFLAAAFWAGACAPRQQENRESSLQAADSSLADSASGTSARTASLEPGALRTVPRTPVLRWTGPGGKPFDVALRTPEREPGHARRFGTITLQTALRARPLDQYPCSSCHVGQKLVMATQRVADAHHEIQPVHPDQTGSRCATCHAGDNVEQLRLESGERASLDESYRLCAQCHFSQADAWAHGAHGKRLDGWQGPRVVMGCTDCHDPHQPALQARIPFRAPQIERPREHQP